MSEQIEHRWANVDGLRIHYCYRPGSGPPVLLLPGGVVDTTALVWKKVLEQLPVHYRLILPDLPGYGQSEAPVDLSYSTDFYIDFLAHFVEAMGEGPVYLCASSMSGAIVLGYALRHPERVRALVLSGAYGLQPQVPLHPLTYRLARVPQIDVWLRRLLRLHPLLVRLALPLAVYHLDRIDAELVRDTFAGIRAKRALMAFVRWMRHDILPHRVRSDFMARLPELSVPTLILHGRHDWLMPFRYARAAAARIPRAELLPFEAGHLVPREWPDRVSEAIAAFLERHAA